MTDTAPSTTGDIAWVDLSTTDPRRALDFYERLLGWGRDEDATGDGSYVVAHAGDGTEVAGVMAMPAAPSAAGAPPCWTVYVAVDDLDHAVDAVEALGGTVPGPPFPVGDWTRIAVVADPAGATLALMERPPAGLMPDGDEPGAVAWVECLSRRPEAALAFYERLFGWSADDPTDGYVVLRRRGRPVAGLLAVPAAAPAEVPSSWLVYFAVDDVPATCAAATALGGTVLEPPHLAGGMTFAVIEDPTGAVFAVSTTPPEPLGPVAS